MGAKYRLRYRQLYKDNTGFDVFANQYPAAPRVIDSARLFARGLMGPNSTLGDVYVIKSSDPRAFANSLAPSDLCSAYKDNGGGDYLTTWENVYLPPITERVNGMIQGNLTFTDDDVSIFPYLCGFETQITGRPSPWCNIFTQAELEQYEYAQDLRYYYGSGPGSGKNSTLMLPVLNAVIRRLQDGPGRTYVNSENETWTPPALIAMFTNDGQINQLASSIGVFDAVKPLSPTSITESIYVASHYVSMRGTISFERLNCGAGMYVRLLLNDVVYPVASCQDGPGRSCSLQDYASLIANKSRNPLAEICSSSGSGNRTDKATFLTDNALPWEYIVKP
ncbi:MAG: hypothetical protein M1820_001281 [Bogoriella megaspora]|nr:MAG: hypothetical protein M1820_001281 [Bogoriella megaspora]